MIGLTANSFQAVISRDSFCAPEVDIFLATMNWVRANPDATSEERDCILRAVRLPLMSTQVKFPYSCRFVPQQKRISRIPVKLKIVGTSTISFVLGFIKNSQTD